MKMIANPWRALCGSPDKDFLMEVLGEVERRSESMLVNKPDQSESFVPMLHVCLKTAKGEDGAGIMLLYGDLSDKKLKREAYGECAKKLFENKLYPGAVFLVCEAWCANAKLGDRTLPSKRDDKQECVIIHGETVDGKHQISSRLIFSRDSEGKAVPVDAWEHTEIGGAPVEGFDMDQVATFAPTKEQAVVGAEWLKERFGISTESPLKFFWDKYRELSESAIQEN